METASTGDVANIPNIIDSTIRDVTIPNIGDVVTIPYAMLKYLANNNEIQQPPVTTRRGRKSKHYCFIVNEFCSEEMISASLFYPSFEYQLTLSYKLFTKFDDTRHSITCGPLRKYITGLAAYILQQRQSNASLDETRNAAVKFEQQKQQETEKCEQLKIFTHGSVPKIVSSFTISQTGTGNVSNPSVRCEEKKRKEKKNREQEKEQLEIPSHGSVTKIVNSFIIPQTGTGNVSNPSVRCKEKKREKKKKRKQEKEQKRLKIPSRGSVPEVLSADFPGFRVPQNTNGNVSSPRDRREEEKEKEKQEQLEIHSRETVSRVSSDFSIPENVNGNVLKMGISLVESKVEHYRCLLANAINQLARLKEKNVEDDPDDLLGAMREIQLKGLKEEYFRKMLDIFNDEPVTPYKFTNIWDDNYPVLDFSLVQRLPLIITFKKDSEFERAFEEYMKGNSIFKLLDHRRVYGSLKVPMWEVDKLNAAKPAILNGDGSVGRFAQPFKNSAVLMYACRGVGCRFYRPNRPSVWQHEKVSGHFTEESNKSELDVEIKCEEHQYSSDESVVEVPLTQSQSPVTVERNRRRSRKKESESTVPAKRQREESIIAIIDLDGPEESVNKEETEESVNKEEMKCEQDSYSCEEDPYSS